MSLRSSLLSLLLLAVACGPPPEVSLSGPSSVTVFAGQSVEVPISLQWDGDPRALTLTGGSNSGLSVASAQVAAGTTQVVLTLSAAEDASDGPVTLTTEAEGLAPAALTLPVTIARATVLSGTTEPLLPGARAEAVVAFSGGIPAFEGAEQAEALADGQWRVQVPVPVTATPGEVMLSFSVGTGGASRALSLPVTVADGVTVTMRDIYGAPLSGRDVFVNGAGPQVTDALGQAHFPGIVAPYRLSAYRSVSRTHADTWVGATVASPVVTGTGTSLPQQQALLEVTLWLPGGDPLSGHTSWGVQAAMQGQPNPGNVSHNGSNHQGSGTIQWYSEDTTAQTRLRAMAYEGQVLRWYSDASTTITSGTTESASFQMRPAALGVLHSSVTLPPGYEVTLRELKAIFAGNRFDWVTLKYDQSSNLTHEVGGALAEDAALHTLIVLATDLAGRYIERRWQGLLAGATASGALSPPPELTSPSAQINDRTEYRWSGGQWPVYRLTLNTGEGGQVRGETVYTSATSVVRPQVAAFFSGTPAVYRICGSDLPSTVDDLLRPGGSFSDPLVQGAYGCDLGHEATFTGP